jgi:uroporphyrinogen-III synthase
LILRPEPGASETAARVRDYGLQPVLAPLFDIHPLEWVAPLPDEYDAVLLTSANAARQAGRALNSVCYAVGEATAAAAHAAGWDDVRLGRKDGAAAVEMMAASGVRRALHLCGREHIALAHPQVRIERRIVYAAEAKPALPETAEEALRSGAVALLHSPRAAATFAGLVGDRSNIRLAVLSEAAAEAAGEGWAAKAVAGAPRDEALLEVAAKLCNIAAPGAAAAGA